jgi:hypothetical protein
MYRKTDLNQTVEDYQYSLEIKTSHSNKRKPESNLEQKRMLSLFSGCGGMDLISKK